MLKRVIGACIVISMMMSYFIQIPVMASWGYVMEYLDRGTVAVKTDDGIFLSWRLLGIEAPGTSFDIYRDGELITTTSSTNYLDTEGFIFNTYQVVADGESIEDTPKAEVLNNNYIDIPITKPENGVIDKTSEVYTYSANDASAADVDGDGEYEIILKWDPSNSKDNSYGGYTGNVYIDCYKLDGTFLWRIDLGKNIRAGAHYTQFIAYDFDSDGKAEVAMKTAPGSVDGTGKYVTEAGNTDEIRTQSNNVDYRSTKSGKYLGQILSGEEYLTMFEGATGKALSTINYEPSRGKVSDWGDSYGNRSERYLAGCAYLDGINPSLIMCRGYYNRASMVAYRWNGTEFIKQWSRLDTSRSSGAIYGQGAHSLSVADVDNDGRDEIIFGSAVVDDDGSVLSNTDLGHGDALHVSDFDNDGQQEIFMVHEDSSACKTSAAELHDGYGNITARVPGTSDNGRGVMGNIDSNPNKNTNGSLFWSVANNNLYDMSGSVVGTAPSEKNFLIYWDGDLSRELLDRNRIVKYNSSTGTERIETFSYVHYNNSTKATPSLVADLFGDWREEVIYPLDDDSALRVFTSVIPTNYVIPTLMHDPQYREAIAWQNVGYNQPPHTSFYIGMESESGNTINPASKFKSITMLSKSEDVKPSESLYTETLLDGASGFNNGSWGFSTGIGISVATIEAPFNKVLSVATSKRSSKSIDSLPTAQQNGIGINSFVISEDGLSAEAVLTNMTDSDISPSIVIAGYDVGGNLTNAAISKAEIAKSLTQTVTCSLPEPAAFVKAMLWENEFTQRPLCDALNTAGSSYTDPLVMGEEDLVIKMSFMWRPISGTDSVSIYGEGLASNRPLLTIEKTSQGAVSYKYYTSSTSRLTSEKFDESLVTSGNWYLVEAEFDFKDQLMDLSILDYTTDGAQKFRVYGVKMPEDTFVSTIKEMRVTGESYIDNITFKKMTYSEKRSVAEFLIVDEESNPVYGAVVNMGNNKFTSDKNGIARIKAADDVYSYSISIDGYKTSYGEIDLKNNISSNIVLRSGEERNVYIHYTNAYGKQISPDVLAGTGIENTNFIASEEYKGDISYTFTEDDFAQGEDDITYEDHQPGDTVVYEYDADNSTSASVRITEDNDTVITYVYKEKRVPVPGLDTSVVSMNMSEDGFGHEAYVLEYPQEAEYVSDTKKYLRVPGIENNELTINIPQNNKKIVMEFDILFENIDFGGNIFGFTPYSENTPGQSVGIRTSSQTTDQWSWVYGSGENYIAYVDSMNSDKSYRYSSNWRGRWAHCILVFDGSGKMKLTIANLFNNLTYVQDADITMLSGVGSESMPITALKFGRISGSGSADIGFAGFKAYTIGAKSSGDISYSTKTVTIPGKTEFTIDTARHISEVEGVDFNITGMVDAEYQIWDENGEVCSPEGFNMSSDGVLTVDDREVPEEEYRVAVIVNGQLNSVYSLEYKKRTLVYESEFVDSTDGFLAGKGSNVTISADSGVLYFNVNEANGGREFFRQFEGLDSGEIEIEFLFKTGGVKGLVTPDVWSWGGYEYEFAVQFLDQTFSAQENAANVNDGAQDTAPEHLIMEISQAYISSGAQDTYYYTPGGSNQKIADKWEMYSQGDGAVLKRSVTTWNVTASLNFDTNKADFSIKSISDSTPGGYMICDVPIPDNGFGALRFLSRKKGNRVAWQPQISDVKVYKVQ